MLESLRSKFSRSPAVPRSTPPALRAEDLKGVLLFELIVCETHAAALQTAVVASGVHALRTPGRLRNPLVLINFVPGLPSVGAHLSRCRNDMGLQLQTNLKLIDFFTDLAPTRERIVAFCADAAEFGAEQAAFLHLKVLTAAMTRAALHALQSVEALDPEVRRCLPVRYCENTAMLATLLTSVLDGREPCVDAQGNLSLPDLPQRRPAPRRSLLLDCVIEHQGKTSHAIIKDASTSGLGLERTPGLVPQKVILIELQDERCLAGMVIWSSGTSSGVFCPK